MKNLPVVEIKKMNCSECVKIHTDCPEVTGGKCYLPHYCEWPEEPDGD